MQWQNNQIDLVSLLRDYAAITDSLHRVCIGQCCIGTVRSLSWSTLEALALSRAPVFARFEHFQMDVRLDTIVHHGATRHNA